MVPEVMAAQATSSLPSDVLFMDSPRKVKNRLAQRRLREKRAQEKKAASRRVEELPDTGVDSLPLPYAAPQLDTSVHPAHQPVQQINDGGGDFAIPSVANDVHEAHGNDPSQTAEVALDARMAATNPANFPFETEIPTWEAQLFDEMFEMGHLENTSAHNEIRHSSPWSDQSSAPSPPPGTQMNARTNSRLSQSQAALKAFRAHLQAIWTSGAECAPNMPKHDRPEPLLHSAARIGNCQVLQMLLDHGADVNARDIDGRTPLHSAIEAFKGDAIIFLLEAGVDVNAHDDQGRTALSMAVQNDCEKAVDLFLRHGADPMLGGSDLLRSTHSGFTNGQRVIEQ